MTLEHPPELLLIPSLKLFHYMIWSFSGGFYSDSLAYVARECKRCPNGSYVAYHKKPGKSVLDCKTCPLGKY